MLCLARAEAGADVTAPWFGGGTGIERGVVEIRCRTKVANVIRLSRGAVLQIGGDAKRDVILATAHGLPESSHAVLGACRVLGAHQFPYGIAKVWRSAKAGEGVAHDWAVLLLQGRLVGEVGRLTPAKVSGDEWVQLADGAANVRVLLRQADPHEGDSRPDRLHRPGR